MREAFVFTKTRMHGFPVNEQKRKENNGFTFNQF